MREKEHTEDGELAIQEGREGELEIENWRRREGRGGEREHEIRKGGK